MKTFGHALFGATLVAACLLSGVTRATEAGAFEEVDLKTFAKQINLKTCPDNEFYFYLALKRDGTSSIDSRVHTSSLESDAQMLLAIQQGDFDSLKDVLEHGVEPAQFDPDRFHHCPVYWAVYFNRPEMVKLLLDHLAEGWMGPENESALKLAQKIHPDMVSVLRAGIKRNRDTLAAELTDNLHAKHVDMPAFSDASPKDVTNFLIGAMNRANVGYLERGVGIASLTCANDGYPPPLNTPAMHEVSLWHALQTIADAEHLKFVVSEQCVTFYSSSAKKPYWDP